MKQSMSRREFLSSGAKLGLGAACCAAAWGGLGSNLVFAQSPQGSGKILVLINFFGGIDGLNWIVPYNNQVYYDRRPNIGIQPNNLLILNNEVGLHPAWAPLYNTVVQESRMAIIQQVGYPNANHSHFESQDIWSLGRRSSSPADERGWIGRLSDLYFDSNYDVVGVGVSQRPDFTANRPGARPIVVNSLRDFGFQQDYYSGPDNGFRAAVAEQNAFDSTNASGLPGVVQESMRKIYSVAQQLRQIDADYTSPITYPNSSLGGSLREIAKLIRSNIGTQVFYTGQGGWDTHSDELTALNGNLGTVANAVDAFIRDLKNMGKWDQVCIGFFSEFGRNCFENGTRGTDHGHGNSMVLIGGDVRGGVYGPTPSAADLSRDDVGYYIDFRSVFKSTIRNHLGLNPDPVFDEPVPIVEPNLPLFT